MDHDHDQGSCSGGNADWTETGLVQIHTDLHRFGTEARSPDRLSRQPQAQASETTPVIFFRFAGNWRYMGTDASELSTLVCCGVHDTGIGPGSGGRSVPEFLSKGAP